MSSVSFARRATRRPRSREPAGSRPRETECANLLTDGQQVYFADFGLASSREFELSVAEADFLADHLVYDRCYALGHLLCRHLPAGVRGGSEHGAFLRDWVQGHRPDGVPYW